MPRLQEGLVGGRDRLMKPTDETRYAEARPYLRAGLALAFLLRFGIPEPGTTFGYYFTMADDFLTEFEMRRSA